MIVPMETVLGLSAVLFGIGVFGFLARRNIILMLVSIEVMLNAVNLALAGFSQQLDNPSGQVLALFVIAVAVAGVGLGLVIALNSEMKPTIPRAEIIVFCASAGVSSISRSRPTASASCPGNRCPYGLSPFRSCRLLVIARSKTIIWYTDFSLSVHDIMSVRFLSEPVAEIIRNPRWSPDGRQMFCSSGPVSSQRLFLIPNGRGEPVA